MTNQDLLVGRANDRAVGCEHDRRARNLVVVATHGAIDDNVRTEFANSIRDRIHERSVEFYGYVVTMRGVVVPRAVIREFRQHQ